MVEYYFWGQISEIKLCCRVGTLWHSENRALISKREKVIANKRTFFWILWMNILLEIWNPFLDLHQTRHFCAWLQAQNFTVLEKGKKWAEKLFCRRIPKTWNFSDYADNQLSRINWIINKLGIGMPETCGHVTWWCENFWMTN